MFRKMAAILLPSSKAYIILPNSSGCLLRVSYVPGTRLDTSLIPYQPREVICIILTLQMKKLRLS